VGMRVKPCVFVCVFGVGVRVTPCVM